MVGTSAIRILLKAFAMAGSIPTMSNFMSRSSFCWTLMRKLSTQSRKSQALLMPKAMYIFADVDVEVCVKHTDYSVDLTKHSLSLASYVVIQIWPAND